MDVSSGRGSVRVCQRCGKEYQAGGYKFCSRECMLGTGTCKKCGKAFQREAVGQKKCRACQGHAQERACPVCGKVVSLQAHRTYCSKACYEQARARVPDHCPVCGVDVPKGRLYCTDACRDRAHGMVRVCQQCGKEFKRGKPDQLYCSQECAWQAQKKREDRVCLQCGKAFHPHNTAKGLYCSHECSGIALRTNMCAVCGKWVPSGRRFCSEECRGAKDAKERIGYERQFDDMVKWMGRLSRSMAKEDRTLIATVCDQCERTFVTTNRQARYCSDRCRRRHANNRKEDRLYWYGKPDLSVTLEKLFVRGGGRCAECGLLMTFSSPINSDEHPSIDHIVPLSKGGTHTWDNVQLMCRGCNRKKSDTFGGTFAQGMAWFEA